VEVDGISHEFTFDHDQARDAYLRRGGIRVLRIAASEVMQNLDGVVPMIERELSNPSVSALR
jgi:very-short-patch-repair endonuclease